MLTLLLAWVNAKYNYNYELTFIAVFILDLVLINSILHLINI